jgi:hypothetical protein
MPLTVRDFRITDRVLAESDPNAGDVVFIGSSGNSAAPFVCVRRLSGPSGHYLDAVEIVDADGKAIAIRETKFELDGESVEQTIATELRDVSFPGAGTYLAQYWVFDDVVGTFQFHVAQAPGAGAGIVDGALDGALSKGTIAWLSLEADTRDVGDTGGAVKQPRYNAGHEFPIWYGYEDGQIYVLTGEGEQQVPGLPDRTSVRLLARSKDKRSLVADVECTVAKLPKDAEWERVARDILVGRRLNLRDGEGAVSRWRENCEISMLTPVAPRV